MDLDVVAAQGDRAREVGIIRFWCLERWITATLADVAEAEQRALLHRYALWHALHRLRRRNNGRHATHGQRVAVQRNIRAAITLLDWLADRGLDLTNARQDDLEQWQASARATARVDAGNFVRWARRNKLTGLDFAATKWDGPQRAIDSEARWAHARRLLHDEAIKAEDRVAGLLVLLYAQPTTAISRLTLEHVHADEHDPWAVPYDRLLRGPRRGHRRARPEQYPRAAGGHCLLQRSERRPNRDRGAGLQPFPPLVPRLEIVALLGLRPEVPAVRHFFCPIDSQGPALAGRLWRGFLIHDGNHSALEPAVHGALIIRNPRPVRAATQQADSSPRPRPQVACQRRRQPDWRLHQYQCSLDSTHVEGVLLGTARGESPKLPSRRRHARQRGTHQNIDASIDNN